MGTTWDIYYCLIILYFLFHLVFHKAIWLWIPPQVSQCWPDDCHTNIMLYNTASSFKRSSYGENREVLQSKSFLLTTYQQYRHQKYGVNLWAPTHHTRLLHSHAHTLQPFQRLGRTLFRMLLKLTPGKKNKINDLTIKPLPGEATKF